MTAFKRVDFVHVVTQTAGTGNLTFGAAVDGSWITVAEAISRGQLSAGDTVHYVLYEPGFREEGFAAISGDGTALVRTSATGVKSSLGVGTNIDCAGGGLTRIFFGIPNVEILTEQDRKSNNGKLAETDVNNNFSTSQTITGTLTVTGAIALTGSATISGTLAVDGGSTEIKKTDDGADGVVENVFHASASPAVNDVPWRKNYKARNSIGLTRSYADEYVEILDATNASEDARRKFRAMVAGTLTEIFGFGSDGFTIGNVTPQGIGTLNIEGGFYIAGVLQTAQTRQAFYVEQSSTTNTSVSGANKLQLGTPDYNTISGATWDGSADEVTLPAGKYHVIASIDLFEETSYGGGATLRLRDVTNGVTIASGQNIVAISTNVGAGQLIVRDFTLAGTAALRLEISYGAGSHTYTTRNQRLEIVRVG